MTKSEVKAIIHEVMERYVLHAEEIDDELIDENRKIFSLNKSLCRAIDEAEDEAEWEILDTRKIVQWSEIGDVYHKCSKCGYKQIPTVEDFKFCPSCGKKMKAR